MSNSESSYHFSTNSQEQSYAAGGNNPVNSDSSPYLDDQYPDSLGGDALSIALIGPDEDRRRAAVTAIAECHSGEIREFSTYPPSLDDVPKLLEQHYDVIMIDLDSHPEYALELVESMCYGHLPLHALRARGRRTCATLRQWGLNFRQLPVNQRRRQFLGHHFAHPAGFVLGVGRAGDGRDVQAHHRTVRARRPLCAFVEIAAQAIGDMAGGAHPAVCAKLRCVPPCHGPAPYRARPVPVRRYRPGQRRAGPAIRGPWAARLPRPSVFGAFEHARDRRHVAFGHQLRIGVRSESFQPGLGMAASFLKGGYLITMSSKSSWRRHGPT